MASLELKTVTFDVAKKLSKLGFPQDCDIDYVYFGEYLINIDRDDIIKLPNFRTCPDEDIVNAPSLALAQQWLREEKDLEVYCVPYIDDTNEKFYFYEIVGYTSNRIPYDSYDSALSAGIEFIVNNLI